MVPPCPQYSTVPLCLDIADLLSKLDELFVGRATLTLLIFFIILLVTLHVVC